MKPTGKVEVIEADLVLLAMGFLKPEHPQFAENVFVAGDAASGASPVSYTHLYKSIGRYMIGECNIPIIIFGRLTIKGICRHKYNLYE